MAWRVAEQAGLHTARNERTGEIFTFTSKAAASKFVKAHEKHGGEQVRMWEGPKQALLFNPGLDGFIDNAGVFHPIRASAGYSTAIERSYKRAGTARRAGSSQRQVSMTRKASTVGAQGVRKARVPGAAAALRRKLGLRPVRRTVRSFSAEDRAYNRVAEAHYARNPKRSKTTGRFVKR